VVFQVLGFVNSLYLIEVDELFYKFYPDFSIPCFSDDKAFIFLDGKVLDDALGWDLSHIFQNTLHEFYQLDWLEVLEDDVLFVGPRLEYFSRIRVFFANIGELLCRKGQKLYCLGGEFVIKVGKLLWFVSKQADFAEHGSVLQNTVVVKTLLVHDMHFSTDNEVDVLWHLASPDENRIFLYVDPRNIFLLFSLKFAFVTVWTFLGHETEGAVPKDVSFEVDIAIFKNEVKFVVVPFEN
jgi:hypothetical protein